MLLTKFRHIILGLNPLDDAEIWNDVALSIYQNAVEQFFKPEFLGRVDGIIYFNTLSKQTVGTLVDRQVAQTTQQLQTGQFGLDLQISLEFRDRVIGKGFDIRYGARPLKKAWNDIMVTPLSQWLLSQPTRKVARANTVVVSQNGSSAPAFELRV